jgi:hypothetical protein
MQSGIQTTPVLAKEVKAETANTPVRVVTSKDGTRIGFSKVGNGPALILVDGAMCYWQSF